VTVTTIPVTGITVDGVALNTLAKTIESKSGRLRVPGARGANTIIADRNGSLWTPDKPYEEGRFLLPMWVLGCDDDGLIPGGSTALKQFYANKDMIQRLFAKRRSLLDVRASQPDGSTRQAMCECTAEVDYEMFNENDAKMVYELTIPSVFWQDIADISYVSTNITATGTSFSAISTLSGGTAPMEDLLFSVKVSSGTVTNPRITDLYTGDYVQLNDAMVFGGAKAEWLIDASTWKSRSGAAGLNYNTAGGTNSIANVVRSNTIARLLALTPNSLTGAIGFTFSGTFSGTTPTATVSIQGRRKFLS